MSPVSTGKQFYHLLALRWVGATLLLVLVFFGAIRLRALTLLVNPDFEAGTDGWTPSPGTTIFQIVGSPVYSGSLAASVTSQSNSTKAIVQNVSGIIPNGHYSLSGYSYKDDMNVAQTRLRLAWYTSTDCSGSQLSTIDSNILSGNTPAYHFLTTGSVIAPTDARCAQIRAQAQPVGSSPATAFFDELQFTLDDSPPSPTPTPSVVITTGLVINEVAWAGTAASSADEWLELHNITTQTISLAGWTLTSTGGLAINLSGEIAAGDYFLLERTDDQPVSDIPAGQLYTGNLGNDGASLFLGYSGMIVDTANLNDGPWPAGSASPDFASMERHDATLPDTDDNWATNNLRHRNGLDAAGNPINGTPGRANSATYPPPPVIPLLISELLYDGLTPSTEGDEFAEICNSTGQSADLTGYKIGDEETAGAGEGMYRLPEGLTLSPGACLIIAKNAAQFVGRFGLTPDFEAVVSGNGYTDTASVPNLSRYSAWGTGAWALTNHGDEFLILGPDDQILDAVAYRNGAYQALGLSPAARAAEPFSMQRIWPLDMDWMAADFFQDKPTPGYSTSLPDSHDLPDDDPISLPGSMSVFWGSLQSLSTFSLGDAPPAFIFARARANGLHFLAITDPGETLTGPAWEWTHTGAVSSTVSGKFVGLRGVTWQHEVDGAVNLFNSGEALHVNHPQTPTWPALSAHLPAQPGIVGQFDTSSLPHIADVGERFTLQTLSLPGDDGLDLTQLYQSWSQGWRVAPTFGLLMEAPDWGAQTSVRTGLVAPALTEESLLDALRERRVFATADANLALAFEADGVWMGSAFPEPGPLTLSVYAVDANAESVTLTLFDRTLPITETTATAPLTWVVPLEARTGHFYWLQAVQPDGDMAVTAPIWIDGQAAPETIWLNEMLPNPGQTDWNGDGLSDNEDEWVELYNPNPYPVSLTGWMFSDETEKVYVLPGETLVPPLGYYVIQRRDSGVALNNSGDLLILYRPDGSISDAISFHDNPGDDISICRRHAEADWWTRCLPSPGAANIHLPPESPLSLSIYDAKRVTEGAWVKVQGYITVPPGVFGKNTMYIQDQTHGIRVKLPSHHGLRFEVGEQVEVIGFLDLFKNEWELDVGREGTKVSRLEGFHLLEPLPVGGGLLSEGYEGLLVQVEAESVTFEPRKRHFWVHDDTGTGYVYVYSSSRISRKDITPDASLTVVGVVNHQAEGDAATTGYRLSPRYQFDLIQSPPSISPAPDDWPSLLPETGARNSIP